MKIIENFLPTEYQNALEKLLIGSNFAWYLNPNTVVEPYLPPEGVDTITDYMQFTHSFFQNDVVTSEHYGLISLINHHLMLLENINTTKPARIKANLNFPPSNYPENHHFSIHTDLSNEYNAITCIYYVNDCDGDTLFFSEDGKTEINRVSPKKGSLVYFDSKIPHAGCPPKNSKTRCVINFNFFI
jgi:hypothetical protein